MIAANSKEGTLNMDAIELLRGQLKAAHQFLDMTVADCTEESTTRRDEGWNIKPICTIYAHIAASEDFMVNSFVRGATPLLLRDGWGEKLGIPDQPTLDKMDNVTAPLSKLREYAAVVFKETDEYLAQASEAELDREIDTQIGRMPAIVFLANIAATHVPGHMGEIAALKGVQGLKGLPF